MYIDIKNFDQVTRQTIPFDGTSSFPAASIIKLTTAGLAAPFAADILVREMFGVVFKGTEEAGVQETDALDVIYGPAIIETDNVRAGVMSANIGVPLTIETEGGVGIFDVLTTPGTTPVVGYLMKKDSGNSRATISLLQHTAL